MARASFPPPAWLFACSRAARLANHRPSKPWFTALALPISRLSVGPSNRLRDTPRCARGADRCDAGTGAEGLPQNGGQVQLPVQLIRWARGAHSSP